MTCFFCKGEMKDDFTNHVVNLENCIIIIKNVPCEKCCQCGEIVYSNQVAMILEDIVEKFRAIVTDVAVFEYEKLAS